MATSGSGTETMQGAVSAFAQVQQVVVRLASMLQQTAAGGRASFIRQRLDPAALQRDIELAEGVLGGQGDQLFLLIPLHP